VFPRPQAAVHSFRKSYSKWPRPIPYNNSTTRQIFARFHNNSAASSMEKIARTRSKPTDDDLVRLRRVIWMGSLQSLPRSYQRHPRSQYFHPTRMPSDILRDSEDMRSHERCQDRIGSSVLEMPTGGSRLRQEGYSMVKRSGVKYVRYAQ